MKSAAANKHARTFAWPRLSGGGIVALLLRLDAAHRQRHYLEELDARMLADIGITWADVHRELARPLVW